MEENAVFGQIVCNEWNEFYAEKMLKLPFCKEEISIRLIEYDEDFEPLEEKPSADVIGEYENTLKAFIEQIEAIVLNVQEEAFAYYKKIYAKYYEKPFEVIFENEKIQKASDGSLHEPLNIGSKEQHFEYMNSGLGEMIISNDQTIIMPFRYLLDQEHGLECKIKKSKVVAVGGIAETIYE